MSCGQFTVYIVISPNLITEYCKLSYHIAAGHRSLPKCHFVYHYITSVVAQLVIIISAVGDAFWWLWSSSAESHTTASSSSAQFILSAVQHVERNIAFFCAYIFSHGFSLNIA